MFVVVVVVVHNLESNNRHIVFFSLHLQIGYWNANGANMEERLNISEEWSSIFSTATLQNKTLIVTTYLNDPYCMLRDTSETKYGNDRFEGFVIDLIGELSELLGFKYVFKLVDDGKYGSVNENGTWNGLIGLY